MIQGMFDSGNASSAPATAFMIFSVWTYRLHRQDILFSRVSLVRKTVFKKNLNE